MEAWISRKQSLVFCLVDQEKGTVNFTENLENAYEITVKCLFSFLIVTKINSS